MLRVGLTGGIGSGKSTVAALLRELGAVVTDADQVAREVVDLGTPGLAAIRERFGATVIRADGGLDRAALAAVVFPDPAALRALEAITGPAITARVRQLRAAVPADRVDVYDMPLLVEKGLWVHEHLTVVVGASEQARLQRLVQQRGIPQTDARARIAAQATDRQRQAAGDLWIDNEGSREQTDVQVRRVWAERLLPYDANLRAGHQARPPEMLTLLGSDPAWAHRGERVCARVAAALSGRGVRVDHIGSTAVPGMLAQDVVDVQVGVRRLDDADDTAFAAGLRRAGYLRSEDNVTDPPGPRGADPVRWAERSCRGQDPGALVHLQVREIGSAGYEFALALRDWLRGDPSARDEYSTLKRQLAARRASSSDYAAQKEAWFETGFSRVSKWVVAQGWTP